MAHRDFIYDVENHQTEVKDNLGNTIGQYLYDGDGLRVKKISSTETTVFVYNAGGILVAEYSTQISQTPQVSYLTTDHLGSPRIVTNETGQVISRKDYTAFGEENFTAQRTQGLGYQPADIRKGYTGYEKDDESGLDFAQARYYNSTHGRFTSVDPLTASASIRNPQTFNRYSYVLNSPYKDIDPLGLLPEGYNGGCNFQCRVTNAINGDGKLSEADRELALFHIRNGTALGYKFLEASYAEIARQTQSNTAANATESSSQTRNCPAGATCTTSNSEQFIKDNFLEPGAYVSNPNDGDSYDQSNGTMLTTPNNNDPHTHAYASVTGEGTLSVYVPKGGEIVGYGTYKDGGKAGDGVGSKKQVPYVAIFFKQLGALQNVTVFIMHVANYSKGPVQADGRRKIGTLGPDVGGEWSFPIRDAKGNMTGQRKGYHFHFELVSGRKTAPVLKGKRLLNWTRVAP